MKAPRSKLSHVDLVVSSIERSLPFYRGLLAPIGWSGLREVRGEDGERIYYLTVEGPGVAALSLRETRSDARGVPYDRYAVGVHHICIDVASRAVVDERAEWLRAQGARIESAPVEYDYTPWLLRTVRLRSRRDQARAAAPPPVLGLARQHRPIRHAAATYHAAFVPVLERDPAMTGAAA